MAEDSPARRFPNADGAHPDRFDWQHELTTAVFNYVVHPKIAGRLPSPARVADIGAGTGVWSQHAARVLRPGTLFTAFDNSPLCFPSNPPCNITYAIADVLQPFPPDIHGTFDLVHLRFLGTSLWPSDMFTVVNNVVPLLRAGGALQWTEARYHTTSCLRDGQEYKSFPTLNDVLSKFWVAVGDRLADQPAKLAEALAESELIDVEFDTVSTDRLAEDRKLWWKMLAPAYTNWAVRTQGLSPEQRIRLKEGIDQDIENGAYLREDLFTVIAFKARPL